MPRLSQPVEVRACLPVRLIHAGIPKLLLGYENLVIDEVEDLVWGLGLVAGKGIFILPFLIPRFLHLDVVMENFGQADLPPNIFDFLYFQS